MKLGDRGYKVKELQEWLIDRGYLDSTEECYGVKTKRAVIKLQKDMGYDATGEFNNSLYNLYHLRPVKGVGFASKPKVEEYSTVVGKDMDPQYGSLRVNLIPCYIINLLTGNKINFLLTPDEISDSNSANFDDQFTKGRSSPFKSYSNSGPRSLSFSITLCDDYCPEGIVSVTNQLKALVYPKYGSFIEPPRCLVRIGSFISMTGVTLSVDITWRKPYKNGVYSFADVNLSFSEVRDVAQDATDVEKGEVIDD